MKLGVFISRPIVLALRRYINSVITLFLNYPFLLLNLSVLLSKYFSFLVREVEINTYVPMKAWEIKILLKLP